MAANGRGGMRAGGRSPQFVVVGLLVVIAILAFNYWNVSARNSELIQEVSALSITVRTANQKKLSVEKKAESLVAKIKENEEGIQKVKNEKDSAVHQIQSQLDNLKEEADRKKRECGECSDGLRACQQNTSNYEGKINAMQDEISQLKENLEKEKQRADEATNAQQQGQPKDMDCKKETGFILQSIQQIYGFEALQKLNQLGVDTSIISVASLPKGKTPSLLKQVKLMHQDGQNQAAQQQGQGVQQQGQGGQQQEQGGQQQGQAGQQGQDVQQGQAGQQGQQLQGQGMQQHAGDQQQGDGMQQQAQRQQGQDENMQNQVGQQQGQGQNMQQNSLNQDGQLQNQKQGDQKQWYLEKGQDSLPKEDGAQNQGQGQQGQQENKQNKDEKVDQPNAQNQQNADEKAHQNQSQAVQSKEGVKPQQGKLEALAKRTRHRPSIRVRREMSINWEQKHLSRYMSDVDNMNTSMTPGYYMSSAEQNQVEITTQKSKPEEGAAGQVPQPGLERFGQGPRDNPQGGDAGRQINPPMKDNDEEEDENLKFDPNSRRDEDSIDAMNKKMGMDDQ